MIAREEILLIIYFIAVFLLLVSFVFVFLFTFQRRKRKLVFEKAEAEKRYAQGFIVCKLEIEEETLKVVARELHDNIGQLLSVANMQLNMMTQSLEKADADKISEIQKVVQSSINGVRELSKIMNHDVLDYLGLEKSIQNELNRLERMNLLKTKLVVCKHKHDIDNKDGVIILRIFQEFLSNVIKHAKASHLFVNLNYQEGHFILTVKDDGIGYHNSEVEKSSGFIKIKERALLINADLRMDSDIDKGSTLQLKYPIRKSL